MLFSCQGTHQKPQPKPPQELAVVNRISFDVLVDLLENFILQVVCWVKMLEQSNKVFTIKTIINQEGFIVAMIFLPTMTLTIDATLEIKNLIWILHISRNVLRCRNIIIIKFRNT
jgi:hypothetical protein